MAVHADGEGLQTAQNEVAIHRSWDSTGRVLQEANSLQRLFLQGHYGAPNHVGVASQILGGTVHHQVGAQPQRLLQIRRRKRVIHAENSALLTRRRADRFQLRHDQERVGRRLQPDKV